MKFYPKSYIEMRDDIVDNITGNTEMRLLIPNSPSMAYVDAILTAIAKYNASVEAFAELTDVTTATGAYLDLIAGNIYGLSRKKDYSAVVYNTDKNIKFYVTTGTLRSVLGSTKIPKGTKIRSADNTVLYSISDDVPIGVSDTHVFASANAINIGSSGNCSPNTLTVHDLNNSSVYVTNMLEITSGTSTESDDMFRSRILTWAIASRSCNMSSLKLELMRIPGISDVKIDSASHGAGTFRVTLIPSSSTVSVFARAQAAAVMEMYAACGIIGFLYEPDYVPIKIAIRLNFNESLSALNKNSIRSEIQSEIRSYLETIPIGGTLVINQIRGIVMSKTEIRDMDFWCLKVNGELLRRINYTLSGNQMFVLDTDEQIPIEVL